MRFVLAQIEVQAGRPDLNFSKIQDYYKQYQHDADLIVFPEMAIPGYLISDNWEDPTFIDDCQYYAEELRKISGECALIFGNVVQDDGYGEDGRPRRWNSCLIAQRGQWALNRAMNSHHFPKTLMPNYREFDDSRYFYDLRKYALESGRLLESLYEPVSLHWSDGSKMKVAPVLCEDSWEADYHFSPAQVYVAKGAEFLCNLSCSPYTHDKFQKRNRVFAELARELQIPIAYCNNVGIQNIGKTLFSFDGRSGFYTPSAEILGELGPWQEGVERASFNTNKQSSSLFWSSLNRLEAIARVSPYDPEGLGHKLSALTYTLKQYMQQSGLKNVVIGVSGGVDSALSAALFAEVIPPENLYLVNMPSRYNSQTTINIARELAENLGAWYMEIPIEDSVALTQSQIDGLEITQFASGDKKTLELSSFHLENVQARDRSSRVLSAIASAVGGVYPSNANKVETLVGYSTLYGDHGGFLVPLGDLWKEEVFELCKMMNEKALSEGRGKLIPQAVFDIPPSAELSDAQDVDAGLGDPLNYEYHDRLLHSWIQPWLRESPSTIFRALLEGNLEEKLALKQPVYSYFENSQAFVDDCERWWRLFKGMGVIKRIQAPTIIALSRRAFGYDYRESILSTYWGREYEDLKMKVLALDWGE